MEFIGYSRGRNLSKIILLISAIAISTLGQVPPLSDYLALQLLNIGIMDYIALSLIIVAFMIKAHTIVPTKLPFFDWDSNKIVYFIALGLIAIEISTLGVQFLTELLDISLFNFPLLAIRNGIAVILLASARIIHNS